MIVAMRAIVIAACLLLLPLTASAAEATRADQLFSEGRELLEKGRFAEACERFRQSEEAAPAIGTLINLAYCYEQIARFRSAMDAYAEAEMLAKQAKDDKREKFARERFAAVEPKSVKLVVRVADAPATGIEVKRNNVVVPPAQWGVPVSVDPEDFVITASAPGHVPWKGAVIGRGEGAIVTIVVPTLEESRAAADAAPVAKAAPTGIGSIGTKRLIALGLGGVALATLGAGTALALGAKSRYDDSRAHCDDAGCDEASVAAQRGAVAQGNVATILFAVGIACVGGGIYLWITGGDEGSTGSPKAARWKQPGVVTW
jgi:tetratricopeptide (TPR) repeat protein